jgi:hypothetical protein
MDKATPTLRQRCDTALQSLPDAPYRAMLAALFDEMLAEVERLAAQAAPTEEMSPEFTDTARAALLWVLWHHQGGSSKVGQPIRFALGMEQHQPLSEYQVREAQRWEAMAPTRDTANVPPGEWNSEPEGLTPKQAWWAGYRVGKGLPPDMSRSEAVADQPSQAPVVQAGRCGRL